MPAGGWRGWAGPVLVTLIAAVLRLVDLGRPNAIAFDETYYVKDGLSLLLFGYERGSVDALADDPQALVAAAVARVRELAGQRTRIPDAPVALPPFADDAGHSASGAALSRATVALIEDAVREAAAAPTLSAALEAGYRAFGASACTAAAREGIAAFHERRKPDFTRTG